MISIQKHSNTMGILSFMIAQMYWGWLAYTFFSARLFSRIISIKSGTLLSTSESQRVLIILLMVCELAGFLLTAKYRRNSWSIIVNTLTPYGIYLILETVPHIPIYIMFLFALIVIFVLLYSIILITAPIRCKRNRITVIKRRCSQLIHGTYFLSGTLFGILTLTSAVGAILGISSIYPQTTLEDTGLIELPYSLSAFSDELSSLQGKQWDKLPLQEKVDLLQLVTQIEVNYLGLPDKLQVCCETLEPYLAGGYAHDDRTIYISRDCLLYDPPKDCVDTILHEVYHSYQHHLCAVYKTLDEEYQSMYFLRDASCYINEFEQYNSGNSDFFEYYYQLCEIDARAYAESRLSTYNYQVNLGWEV